MASPAQTHSSWRRCLVDGSQFRFEAQEPTFKALSLIRLLAYVRIGKRSRFLLGWKMLGLEQSLGSRIVTYADDLVILCRRGKAEEALQKLRKIMSKLKPEKISRTIWSARRSCMSGSPPPIRFSTIARAAPCNMRCAIV